jgi:aminomethyltransferase
MRVQLAEVEVAPIQIQGPKSKQVVRELFGDSIAQLRYYYFNETRLDGIPVVVTRTGWTGEVGFEVYLRDSSRGSELWDKVMEAGRPFGIAPTGPSDIRRIEAGILNYGADMTLENNPYEVGLDWMVDLDQQADFIGRAALERIRAEGVKRKLVGVEIAGDRIEFNMTKWPVMLDGSKVGHVSSAIYSPRLKKNIGYAMVGAQHGEVGTRLKVSLPEAGLRDATVVPKPFVDPSKEIPKA